MFYGEPSRADHSHSLANWKSLFQMVGATIKCSSKHLEQGAIKSKNHILLSCSAAAGGVFAKAGSLTEAKISS